MVSDFRFFISCFTAAGSCNQPTPFRKRGVKNKKEETPVVKELAGLIERADRIDAALNRDSPEGKKAKYEDPTVEAFGTLVAVELDQIFKKDGDITALEVKEEIYHLLSQRRRGRTHF